jgi:hypothetical protein
MTDNQKDIIEIRTAFGEFKEDTNTKLDKIFKKLNQNQFSPNQVLSFFGGLIVIMASIMIYIEGIKSNTRNNSTRVSNVEHQYKSIEAKLDRLIESSNK